MIKTWARRDEWTAHSLCGGDSRFITDPKDLSEDDVEEVKFICHKCPVRPECLSHTIGLHETGVWTASEWIPAVNIGDTPRQAVKTLVEAAEIRLGLSKTIQTELELRGEF